VGREEDEVGVFLACVEGVSFVEALIYELIESLGGVVGENLFATGGATLSLLGLEVRAAVLQKRIRVPAHPNSVMGAAILAAAGFHEEPVGKWSSRMVRILRTIEPSDSRMSYYRDRLAIFREHCYQGLP
jgi:sugar (pentulose or hexulose) kinase